MGKIRHLAIRTEDPERLAEFYKDVFGLTEVHRGSHPGMAPGKTVHLTDGYFELALLDNAAQQSRNGLYHFGIQIDDMDETLKRAGKAQPNKHARKRPDGTPFAELRVSDPDGNYIDLSVHGFLEYEPLKKSE